MSVDDAYKFGSKSKVCGIFSRDGILYWQDIIYTFENYHTYTSKLCLPVLIKPKCVSLLCVCPSKLFR